MGALAWILNKYLLQKWTNIYCVEINILQDHADSMHL